MPIYTPTLRPHNSENEQTSFLTDQSHDIYYAHLPFLFWFWTEGSITTKSKLLLPKVSQLKQSYSVDMESKSSQPYSTSHRK